MSQLAIKTQLEKVLIFRHSLGVLTDLLDRCLDYLYFNIQRTEKFSKAMCQNRIKTPSQLGAVCEDAPSITGALKGHTGVHHMILIKIPTQREKMVYLSY